MRVKVKGTTASSPNNWVTMGKPIIKLLARLAPKPKSAHSVNDLFLIRVNINKVAKDNSEPKP